MKKLFIAALMVVAAGTSAFALDINKDTYKAKKSFQEQFVGAENITWTAKDNFIKASFTLADEKLDAFFGNDGELIAMSRKVKAIQKIKKDYSAYTVNETIELDQDGSKSYYVSLQNGDKKKILEVSLYGNVSLFQGSK